MYEDGIDGDSLKDLIASAVRRIDIGAAVLPEPLFASDVHEPDDRGPINSSLVGNVSQGDSLREHNRMIKSNSANCSSDNSRIRREGRAPDNFSILNTIPTLYAETLRKEFNAVVVEHHLKWAPLCVSEPGPNADGSPSLRLGRYDFHHADAIVDWALKQNMKVKGHVLVWHITSPKILEDLSPDDVREQLRRHIFTTMGHFRGRIKVWDVVNEALAPDGTLAENIFLRKIGPEYIEQCFRWAHQADPNAILLYNDNKVEGMNGPNKSKADGFYRLLAGLVKRSVPIHGCGIQAHFNAAGSGRNRVPTPHMIKNQIRRLGNLGLRVNISEMDVRVSQLAPELRRVAQRQIYHDIIIAALTEPAFDGIWLWGFTDKHTWVTEFYHEDEPLVFDDFYRRKDSYYGLRDALRSITLGGEVGGSVLLDCDVDKNGNDWGYPWIQPYSYVGESSVQQRCDGVDSGDQRPDWEL